MSQKTILSTKKLSQSQEAILLDAGLSFESYDAITIIFIDFVAPKFMGNAIFTSQNGVDSFFKNRTESTDIKQCFCVGEKTALKLEENGQNVIKIGRNASELAHFIVKNHKNDSFSYICGSHRRDELPTLLKEQKIPIIELKTYKTQLNKKHFDQKWDGIMFFSPTGVESFVGGQNEGGKVILSPNNAFKKTIAICIGETTAAVAKKYISNVIVANSTTVESVIDATVKTMTNDKN